MPAFLFPDAHHQVPGGVSKGHNLGVFCLRLAAKALILHCGLGSCH
jgi:hypothetical protein